ncbi:hypothetical protein D3C80_1508140 [compost metagenome]
MALAIGLHEILQRPFGLGVIDRRMIDAAGQRTTYQHRRAIADPFAHRFQAGGLATEIEQHLVHSHCQVRDRIDQRAVQIEHHQPWQLPREQLLKATHGRASASSERILSMTS